MTDRDQLDQMIIGWARDRGIFDHANPIAQCAKTIEEATETLQAIIKLDSDDIQDGIGDVYVTLVLLAHMLGMTVHECAGIAYREISERKGSIINGFFVKGGDND